MMKNLLSVVMLLGLSFGIGGAEEDAKAKNPEHGKSIQPRAMGAVWNYDTTTYEDGEVATRGIGREKVVAVMEIEGVQCYRVEISWEDVPEAGEPAENAGDLSDREFLWEYMNEKGIHEFHEDEDAPEPPKALADFSLMLKYPVEKGAQYQVEEERYEVLNTDEKIKVPAGEFECVVYQAIIEDADEPEFSSRNRFYMSPGVGLIRSELDLKNEQGEWVLSEKQDLKNYDLKVESEKKEDASPDTKE